MKIVLALIVGVLIGVGLGNHNGDQATLRDCATTGKASMKGGGTITCAVVKTN